MYNIGLIRGKDREILVVKKITKITVQENIVKKITMIGLPGNEKKVEKVLKKMLTLNR